MNAANNAVTLAPCPFCGNQLFRSSRPVNPKAYCRTEDCFGKKMPVVNLDDPVFVAAWNTRALSTPNAPAEQSNPETLLADAQARQRGENLDGSARRETVAVEQREAIARCMVQNDPNYVTYHMPGEKPRKWRASSGAVRNTSELSEDQAEKVRVRADVILAVRLDEAAIRKDEREKCAKIAEHDDRWGEWSKFVVRQQMVPVTAMQVAIAQAIRNGGKQP